MPKSNFLPCPVSKINNLDDITQIKQNRNIAASKLRPIVAIDTETYKGNIIVIILILHSITSFHFYLGINTNGYSVGT
jgi:hypothetical protein